MTWALFVTLALATDPSVAVERAETGSPVVEVRTAEATRTAPERELVRVVALHRRLEAMFLRSVSIDTLETDDQETSPGFGKGSTDGIASLN